MNILFLDAYYEPETIAYTHLEKDLIEGLIADGHIIHIICPTPTRGISDEVRKQYKRIKSESKYDGSVIVERFWAPQEGKNPLIRAFRYFWCNLRTYQQAVKQINIDVVFSNSTPPTQGALSGLVAKKLSKKSKKKVPFIYNLQDIFPDSLVNAGMASKDGMLWKIGRKLENFTYDHAEKIITISDDFKRNIKEKGVPEEKIVVIPNWVNTDNVYPVEREDNILFERYNLDRSKFYICYSGNLGHSQNLELLVNVAEDVQITMPDVVFVLIGEGAAKSELTEVVEVKKLSNIFILPFQPYEDIAHVFSLGDVGLIMSKPGIGGSSVPSKSWSIMAASRPILASFDRDSELTNLVTKLNCGISTDPSSPSSEREFIEAIQTIKHADRETLGENGLQYIKTVVNKDKCVRSFADVFLSTQEVYH